MRVIVVMRKEDVQRHDIIGKKRLGS